MTNEQKKQVRDALVRYCAGFATQALAADALLGISESTISNVKNNNWELISDHMWHNMARQVGFYCGEWQAADTNVYLLLRLLLGDAQHYHMSYCISTAEGIGKTFTVNRYARENENVFYIQGNGTFNRRSFMIAMMKTAGLEPIGSVPEMMDRYTAFIASFDEAVVVFDDADALKDRVLQLVVLVANELVGKAGVMIMGNMQLRERIIEGARLKKPGFEEIFKSIRSRFVTLSGATHADIAQVCRANNVQDDEAVKQIQAESGSNLHSTVQLINRHLGMSAAA